MGKLPFKCNRKHSAAEALRVLLISRRAVHYSTETLKGGIPVCALDEGKRDGYRQGSVGNSLLP